MTPEKLYATDGPTLAQYAFDFGLAPAHIAWYQGYTPRIVDTQTGYAWRPWEDVEHAHAVFRALRARGWNTVAEWRAEERPEGYGHVAAYRQSTDALPGGTTVAVEWPLATWPTPAAPTEAHALLLVACLAVASASKED